MEKITQCRICLNDRLSLIDRFENLPVAGIYYESNQTDFQQNISIIKCNKCGHIQLEEILDEEIYKEYHFVGNSAQSYEIYLEQFVEFILDEFQILQEHSIFEVGASNGVLLAKFKEKGFMSVYGIEPSKKLCEDALTLGIEMFEGYLDNQFVKNSTKHYDVIIIRHVFEHINDLTGMVQSIEQLLAKDGVLIVEVPDITQTVKHRVYSNIFHEHVNYFSLFTLNRLMERFKFECIFNKEVDIHGGSILSVYKRTENIQLSKLNVDIDVLGFMNEAKEFYQDLSKKIISKISEGKKVYGFGASHRTFNLLGMSDLNAKHIPYIYENNELLIGKKLNALASEIISPVHLKSEQPDAIVIFASSYENEIVDELRNKYQYNGEIISTRVNYNGASYNLK